MISAATCEFLAIVTQLLTAGANASIPDEDGCLPVNSTDHSSIKELLQTQKE